MNTEPTNFWHEGFLLNANRNKKYFIPSRINHSNAWILPANFFLECQDWTILFDVEEVRIFLQTHLGINICLQKKMSHSEKQYFEKEWLVFQSSIQETFDLRGFKIIV